VDVRSVEILSAWNCQVTTSTFHQEASKGARAIPRYRDTSWNEERERERSGIVNGENCTLHDIAHASNLFQISAASWMRCQSWISCEYSLFVFKDSTQNCRQVRRQQSTYCSIQQIPEEFMHGDSLYGGCYTRYKFQRELFTDVSFLRDVSIFLTLIVRLTRFARCGSILRDARMADRYDEARFSWNIARVTASTFPSRVLSDDNRSDFTRILRFYVQLLWTFLLSMSKPQSLTNGYPSFR